MTGKKLPVVGADSRDPLTRLLEGDSADVIEALKATVAAEPEDDLGWLRLGSAYLHIGHLAEAADALGRAVELDGDVVMARRLYATALTGLRRHDEAAFQLVRAKRLAPDDAGVARELGAAFYDKKLYPKARQELERARALAPEDARVHYALGLVGEAEGKVAEAIVSHREAVRLDPSFVEARRTLADALASLGELHGATEQLAQALAHDRTNAQVAMNLEVLRKALADLEGSRLLGKTEAEVERSALIREGQLKRRGRVTGGERETWRYASELAELWCELEDGHVASLTFILPNPEAAARASGEAFQVTVVREELPEGTTNFATAATLTFLREALGCPMTTASSLYARALGGEEGVSWAGAKLRFVEESLGDHSVHGLRVAL